MAESDIGYKIYTIEEKDIRITFDDKKCPSFNTYQKVAVNCGFIENLFCLKDGDVLGYEYQFIIPTDGCAELYKAEL